MFFGGLPRHVEICFRLDADTEGRLRLMKSGPRVDTGDRATPAAYELGPHAVCDEEPIAGRDAFLLSPNGGHPDFEARLLVIP
jgi:hypothetical protein